MKCFVISVLIAQAFATPVVSMPPNKLAIPISQAHGFVLARGEGADFQLAARSGSSFVFFHVSTGLRIPSEADRLIVAEQSRQARQAGLFVGAIHTLTFGRGNGATQASRFVDNIGADGQQLPGVALVPYHPKCFGRSKAHMRKVIAEFFVVYNLLTNRKPTLAISRRAWQECIGDWRVLSVASMFGPVALLLKSSQSWHELPITLFDWDLLPTGWTSLPYPPPLQRYTFRRVSDLCTGTHPCECCVLFHGTPSDLQRFAQVPQNVADPLIVSHAMSNCSAPNSTCIPSRQCSVAILAARAAITAGGPLPVSCRGDLNAPVNQEPQPGTSGYGPPGAKRPRQDAQPDAGEPVPNSTKDIDDKDELRE